MAKEGYTKSGKSLKAVRRYYALQNKMEKAKSPDDNKLSKRIAAELKTQQEANTKRLGAEVKSPQAVDVPMIATAAGANVLTDRSELPEGIIMSPKQTGPVFMTPEAAVATGVIKSSAKSLKSHKSQTPVRYKGQPYNPDRPNCLESYCIGGVIVEAIVFFGSLMLMMRSKQDSTIEPWRREINYEIKYMAVISFLVLISVMIWISKKNRFFLGILSLVLLLFCCIGSVVLLATSRRYSIDSTYFVGGSVFDMTVTAVFMLIVTFDILQILLLTLMILHIIGLSSAKRGADRSARTEEELGLSEIFSPNQT